MSTENLSPQAKQLLQQMHDIAPPEPISWWPLAPGWWLLIGGCMALIIGLVYRYWLAVKQRRYRKEALALLRELAREPQKQSVAQVNEVLKRTALYAYPNERADIAKLYGQSWVQWLNQKCKAPVFAGPAADQLSEGAYRAGDPVSLTALLDSARQWIMQHSKAPKAQRSRHA